MTEEKKETQPTKRSAFTRQFLLWRNYNYLILWSGQTISSIGSGITQLAYPLLALALTGAPIDAGITNALGLLGFAVLGLPAGALIDRWDRKWIMIVCDAGRAISLASIVVAAMLGHLTIVQLFITSTIEGALYVFFNIAQVASLTQIVGKEHLPDAMGQSQITTGVTGLISPSISGILYGLNSVLPFLTDSISYAVSVISLLFIKTPFQERGNIAARKLGAEIREGLTWLWHYPLIRTMMFVSATANLVLPGTSLIVIVRMQSQHVSSTIIGLIFGFAGVGTIIAALLAPTIQQKFRFGVIVPGLCWINVFLWPFYLIAPNAFALGLVMVVVSSLGPIYNTVIVSYRLALTPDRLQGRVNSVVRVISIGIVPINYVLTGALLQWFGVATTVVSFWVVLLILAVMTMLNTHIRQTHFLANIEKLEDSNVQTVK